MITMKNLISFILVTCFVISACNINSKKERVIADKDQKPFNAIVENYYLDRIRMDPVNATFFGEYKYNNKFPNFLSAEHQNELAGICEKYLNDLWEFEASSLSKEELISRDIIIWECNNLLKSMEFGNEYFPLDQTWSADFNITLFAGGNSAQPFKTVQDYKNWLARLDEFLIWLDTAQNKMLEGIEKGYVLPKSLIEKTIPNFKKFGTTEVKEHLFYNPVEKFPESFSDQDKKELTEMYANFIAIKLIPAYKEIYRFLSNEYLKAGRETHGYSDLPNGEDWYNHRILINTTTSMTAAEIHEIGLREVERISREMNKVKEEVGFTGSLRSFFDFVRENKELMPFTDPQEVIENYNAIHKKMIPQLDKLFGFAPKTEFEVRRIEAFREKTTGPHYIPGSYENNVPGIFYVSIPNVSKYNIYDNEDLFLHEAIPGHHYQISLTKENTNLPKFRQVYWNVAYGEGWAMYCESLGNELGLYTDPFQYFGMLNGEMHRAVRLVVDTGIHTKGWTREQAIQYSLDNEAESEQSIISEIERYMANPGQALGYKIGQIKIMELRAKAEKELGAKFDIRKFHRMLLESGCLPLTILEKKVNYWIEEMD